MKLTLKLTLLFSLFSILPVSIVAHMAYITTRKSIENNTTHHLTSINLLKQAELERWIDDKKHMLRSLARRPLIRQYGAVLVSDISTGTRWNEAYKKIAQEHFKATLDEEGGFMELFLIRETDGLILVSSDKSCERKYRENRPYFLTGRNKTFVQNPYYDLSKEQPVMTVSTPVKSADNTVIAVLAGHVNLTELSDIMLKKVDHTKSENKETYLVNQFNFIVAGESIDSEQALKKAIRSDGVDKALKHINGFEIYKNYKGITVFGAYRWIPQFEMAILTELNRDEAFAPIIVLRKTILILVGVVILIVFSLGIYFAHTFTRPVYQLVKGADEFGQGNLDFRVETKGKNEIGMLAVAFNQMAEKRQNADAELIKSTIYLNAMGDALIVLDIQKKVIKLNRAARELFGYSPDEIPGLTFEKLFPEKEHQKHFYEMNLAVETGVSRKIETVILTKSGKEIIVQLTGTALKDSQGKPTAFIGVCSDITQRKQMENELLKHRENLEQLVDIRTAELKQSQSQLIVAEKMSALGTMTAGIAHEMNNPMMGILNFVQYCIKHTLKDDRRYEVLQDAESSTNDCIKIIKNLLTFSRIEKQEEEEFKKNSCDSILARVLKLLSYRIEMENISFAKYNHLDTPAIRIKVTNIQQVFLNILGNALDALKESDEKKLKVDIRPEGEFVRITITDSGCGIRPQDFPKIYDPFFTTKPVGKGTGLGLSVCTGIVQDHGGTLSCESEVGKGTSFKILLPIERA